MARGIFQFEKDGVNALGFDTGLDSRSFAQARLADSLPEPGFIVFPDGGVQEWKASGVIEHAAGTMIVWGQAFHGERLDLLLDDESRRDEALAALVHWIKARLVLEEKLGASPDGTPAPLPCAAMIAGAGGAYPAGTIFFCPENFARRAVRACGEGDFLKRGEAYLHPDFSGAQSAAFSAAAMLYRLFAGQAPFSAACEDALRQNIREGNFLPADMAAPGIDNDLANLIMSALNPADKNSCGAEILSRLLAIIDTEKSASFFFHALSGAEQKILEKNKKQFIRKKNITVNTKHFVMRNTSVLLICLAAVIIISIAAFSIVKNRSRLPTTAGLSSAQAVETYYNAFGELNHEVMEACVSGKAGKDDINFVVNLFVINRVRQAYEQSFTPFFIPAAEWQETGVIPPGAQVFGVTDLRLEHLFGAEDSEQTRYRAVYTLWTPRQRDAETIDAPAQHDEIILPQRFNYTDELTLVRKKGAWRITEITRRAD